MIKTKKTNSKATSFELECKQVSILHFLHHHSLFMPNKNAFNVIDSNETIVNTITFKQLHEKVMIISNFLKLKYSHTYSKTCLLVFNNSIDFIIAFLGCIHAGMIPVPAYAPKKNHHMTRLNKLIENAEAICILSHAPLFEKVLTNHEVFTRLTKHDMIDINSIENTALPKKTLPTKLNKTAFLQYTSGSTGDPKGVIVTQENIVSNCEYLHKNGEFNLNKRILSWLPNYHDMGLISGFMWGIYAGSTTYIMQAQHILRNPLLWLKCISKYKITHSGAPNFAYELCSQKAKTSNNLDIDLSSWEAAYNGAEPIKPETLIEFTKTFSQYKFNNKAHHPCYGLAEATLMISGKSAFTEYNSETVLKSALEKNQIVSTSVKNKNSLTFISAGLPIKGTDVLILNPYTKKPQPNNTIGEIHATGKSIAKGYYRNHSKTNETFVTINQKRYLKTGDLGFIRHDGELFITGRLKDLIIINGRNLYPSDIENAIESISPAVQQHGTIVFENSSNECIALIEISRQFLKKENLFELNSTIKHKIFDLFEITLQPKFVSPFSNPKTSSGKKQRSQAKQAFLNEEINFLTYKEKPAKKVKRLTTETEKIVLDIVNQTLGTTISNPETNLSDMGANSLIVFQIATDIESKFGIRLTQNMLTNNLCIHCLSAQIDKKQNDLISELSLSLA